MKDCNEIINCMGRREFFVKAGFTAGALLLTINAAKGMSLVEDIVVAIDEKSPLNKIGGSTIVESPAGKIIIARTGEATFVAFSAKCTHKGGTVEYDAAKKQFECPKHHSKFAATDGSVLDGPADDPLPKYAAKGSATSVTVSTGS